MITKLLLPKIFFVLLSLSFTAQEAPPVKWEFSISDSANIMGLYEITITATIDDHWHMYSQYLPSPDDGPLPTIFSFSPSEDYKIVGKTEEVTSPISKFDDVFEVQVNYFDKSAAFKQLVHLNSKENTVIKGMVSYMVCNETTCLPPEDVPFSITVKH